jgi:hypothetical protein
MREVFGLHGDVGNLAVHPFSFCSMRTGSSAENTAVEGNDLRAKGYFMAVMK